MKKQEFLREIRFLTKLKLFLVLLESLKKHQIFLFMETF